MSRMRWPKEPVSNFVPPRPKLISLFLTLYFLWIIFFMHLVLTNIDYLFYFFFEFNGLNSLFGRKPTGLPLQWGIWFWYQQLAGSFRGLFFLTGPVLMFSHQIGDYKRICLIYSSFARNIIVFHGWIQYLEVMF